MSEITLEKILEVRQHARDHRIGTITFENEEYYVYDTDAKKFIDVSDFSIDPDGTIHVVSVDASECTLSVGIAGEHDASLPDTPNDNA